MIKLYLIVVLIGLVYSCISMQFGKIDKNKVESLNNKIAFLLKKHDKNLITKCIALCVSIQLLIIIFNYILFSEVITLSYVMIVGCLSIISHVYLIIRSINIFNKCINRYKRPFSVFVTCLYRNPSIASNIIFVDTFIVFYTLLHI